MTDEEASPAAIARQQALIDMGLLALANPDLRLGQIISNAVDADALYDISDRDLVAEMVLAVRRLKS